MRSDILSCKRAEKFLTLRVGVELCRFSEELGQSIKEYQIDQPERFIITPIISPRDAYIHCNPDTSELSFLLPDMVLPLDIWEDQVAVSISNLPMYSTNNERALEVFETLFRHAMYLPTPVVIIDCPETRTTQASVATVINEILENNYSEKLILFRVRLGSSMANEISKPTTQSNNGQNMEIGTSANMQSTWFLNDEENVSSGVSTCSLSQGSRLSWNSNPEESIFSDWACWDKFRDYINPDHRFGVCLEINDDLEYDIEILDRWKGEPVRMVTMSLDGFSSRQGFPSSMQPAGGIREFLRMIAISNSLVTSFVVQARPDCDIQENIRSLVNFCDTIRAEQSDSLMAWNDVPLSPLQPLANNLDSNTYQVFETDSAKYSKYHEAMIEALDHLLMRKLSTGRTKFVVMVLGAGRGPLVDAMIQAIHKLNNRELRFKIYALDKNFSSIVSLEYKKRRRWYEYLPNIEIEVVRADMRVWDPKEKADIIATELLGSFSDNELSPECIDGTWRFATKDTISIPESYCSYLAPISSYRMVQEMYKSRYFSSRTKVYDRIQVVRLTNYYRISDPQPLFHFQHIDLSKKPEDGANQREATLVFQSRVAATCHGFAGYFSAKLFGSTTISTVPEFKTPMMESWFPVYIPLEKPLHLIANDLIELKFYRKESKEKVWYEWMITQPEQSRVHSQDGSGTAMSKIIVE